MSQEDAPGAETAPPTESPQIDALRKELASQADTHLRLAADFENFKRRTRSEFDTRAAAQKEAFIGELFPVIDNLERALASFDSKESLQFHQGVEITLKQLQQLLRLHGIESTELVGLPFDPHRHESLSKERDPTQPDHSILKVFQRGYWHGEKVLRPAKVGVNDHTHHRNAPHVH